MPPQPLCVHLIACALLLGLLASGPTGCQTESERPFIRPLKAPGREMGAPTGPDAGGGEMGQDPSPQCQGQFEGAQCDLPGATGVCLGGSCQLLGCLDAFGDCDGQGENGCETPFSADQHCGGCAVQCGQKEACQRSQTGYVCGVGVVCPLGAYDLDQSLENGCEWQELPVVDSPLKPFQYFSRIDRVVASDAIQLAAGGLEEDDLFSRQVITSADPPDAPPQTIATPGSQPARQILVLPGQNYSVVLWPDLLSIHPFGQGALAQQEISQMCQSSLQGTPWGWESMTAWPTQTQPDAPAWLVVGAHTVMPVKACESPVAVEDCFWRAAQFGQADYVRHFFPYQAPQADLFPGASPPRATFLPEEVVSCTPCAFDLITGALNDPLVCEDDRQCRPLDFEPESTCTSCTEDRGRGCPVFEPKQVVPSQLHQGRAYVVTGRGVLALSFDASRGTWEALGRWERAFEPGVIGGRKFVAGTVGQEAGQERVFLLGSDRQVLAYDVVEEAGGDGVRFVPGVPGGTIEEMGRPAQGRFIALDRKTVAWGDAEAVGWMAFTPRGVRRVLLQKRGGLGGGGFFGLEVSKDQISVLELQFGNLRQRTVVRKE